MSDEMTITNPTPTEQDETLEPPERIWIDAVDCCRDDLASGTYYTGRPSIASIEYVRAAVAGPRVDRALISELIHIAAELARGTGFLSICAEDMSPRLKRADILKTAERQELQLKDWANRVRQVADKLSTVGGPRGDVIEDLFKLMSQNAAGEWCFNSLSVDWAKFQDVMKRLATTSSPTPAESVCLLCGHNEAVNGYCTALVPICSDDYHGTHFCGCKCEFTAPAENTRVEGEQED